MVTVQTSVIATLILVVGLLGGYLKAYMGKYGGKKGELQAMHEGIDNLIEQVDVVEKHQEKMKADILDAVWERQTRWTVKKEILFETLREVGATNAAFNDLAAALETIRADNNPDLRSLNAKMQSDAVVALKTALYKLNAARALAEIVIGKRTRRALLEIQTSFLSSARKSRTHDLDDKDISDLAAALAEVSEAVREELDMSEKDKEKTS